MSVYMGVNGEQAHTLLAPQHSMGARVLGCWGAARLYKGGTHTAQDTFSRLVEGITLV